MLCLPAGSRSRQWATSSALGSQRYGLRPWRRAACRSRWLASGLPTQEGRRYVRQFDDGRNDGPFRGDWFRIKARYTETSRASISLISAQRCSPPALLQSPQDAPVASVHQAEEGDADETQPDRRIIRVLQRPLGRRAIRRTASSSYRTEPGHQGVVAARQARPARICPLSDRVFYWCRCHLGLAVLPRYAERRNDRGCSSQS